MSYQSKTISPFDFYANSLIENVKSTKTAAPKSTTGTLKKIVELFSKPQIDEALKGDAPSQIIGGLSGAVASGGASYAMGTAMDSGEKEKSIVATLSALLGASAGRRVGKNVWMNKNKEILKSKDFAKHYPDIAKDLRPDLNKLQRPWNVVDDKSKMLIGMDMLFQGGFAGIKGYNRSTDSNIALNEAKQKALEVENKERISNIEKNQVELDAIKNAPSGGQAPPSINVNTPEIKIPQQPAPVVTVNNSNGEGSTPKSMIDQFPGGRLGLGVAAGIAIPSVYALYHFSRAAQVIGDGRSIRLSGSLRKRRGQATDLNFGVAPYKPPTQKELDTAAKARAALPGGGAFDDEAGFADEEF